MLDYSSDMFHQDTGIFLFFFSGDHRLYITVITIIIIHAHEIRTDRDEHTTEYYSVVVE
jgi:hypothetical protein